jgi:hypothetical protein
MARYEDSHFVLDGRERAREASFDGIRAQVEAEYAERLQAANWARRLLLKAEMRREIERRLDRIAPPDALYLHDKC